jgi:hypothetical protein
MRKVSVFRIEDKSEIGFCQKEKGAALRKPARYVKRCAGGCFRTFGSCKSFWFRLEKQEPFSSDWYSVLVQQGPPPKQKRCKYLATSLSPWRSITMRKYFVFVCALAVIVCLHNSGVAQSSTESFNAGASPAGTVTATTIKQSFFGTDFLLPNLVWPGTDGLHQISTLGGLRLWDDGVKWGQINTSRNVYNWSQLDSWISMAQSQHLDVLYTFGDTPQYAGVIPTARGVHCLTPSAYSCSPPTDVNADGTGTDASFSSFVTALVTRYKGRIAFYELWNEPDCSCYFAGSQAQLVRMGKDASRIIRSIDPNAKILSPSGHVWTMKSWFAGYIQAGGAANFDIVNIHMRGTGPLNVKPESFLETYSNIEAQLKINNLTTRPLWDSEHGIRGTEPLPDPDEQAGYVAREVALRAGLGIARQYVYAWDGNPPLGLQGNEAGTAWDTMAKWLIGHSISPCVAKGTVYSCNLDNGQIVWDSAQSCSNGTCTASKYTYPVTYKFQTNLSNQKTALTAKTVSIGYKPIFLTAK